LPSEGLLTVEPPPILLGGLSGVPSKGLLAEVLKPLAGLYGLLTGKSPVGSDSSGLSCAGLLLLPSTTLYLWLPSVVRTYFLRLWELESTSRQGGRCWPRGMILRSLVSLATLTLSNLSSGSRTPSVSGSTALSHLPPLPLPPPFPLPPLPFPPFLNAGTSDSRHLGNLSWHHFLTSSHSLSPAYWLVPPEYFLSPG
jgi:hypothetical protein